MTLLKGVFFCVRFCVLKIIGCLYNEIDLDYHSPADLFEAFLDEVYTIDNIY